MKEYQYSIPAREYVEHVGFDSCITISIQQEHDEKYNEDYYGLLIEFGDRVNASTSTKVFIPSIESKDIENIGMAYMKIAAQMAGIEKATLAQSK